MGGINLYTTICKGMTTAIIVPVFEYFLFQNKSSCRVDSERELRLTAVLLGSPGRYQMGLREGD